MEVNVYVNINGDYKITSNNKTIADCKNPVGQYGDLLKNMFTCSIDVNVFDSSQEPNLNTDNKTTTTTTTTENKSKYEPVGCIDEPQVGDLIYVECITGILKNVFGGVATISDVVESDDLNLMICIDELQGTFINWNDLKDKQDELKEKYGYKPAMFI